MTESVIVRPDASEYAPFYAGYVAGVPDGDVLTYLAHQLAETTTLLGGIHPSRGTYRYAPGKWSINEVVGHLSDVERVFTYRALRFSRGDPTPLAGFEQDDYVAAAGFDRCALPDLVQEFRGLRETTLTLFGAMTPDMLARRGTANDVEFSVRAIAYILAGHARHHVQVLRERYL